MIKASVNDPMTILESLEEFRPELILMDLHVPGCSGQELAVVIRQQASHAAIPIVFLSVETNAPLALVMVDIDRFKSVNDAYGHAAGDAVIKSLARLTKERLRATDVIGRMGGEEFGAVLADTGAAGAAIIFDQLRRAFARIRRNAEGREFSVTMSCGVAQVPGFNDASRLSNAADNALYAAKHNGRNRVETAPADVEEYLAAP